MTSKEKHFFQLLKKDIVSVFLKNHDVSIDIKNWKGEEIVSFQEDLLEKVKTKVSEKWFYTYFKNEADKLPRIDMLNILSEYVGCSNWANYKKTKSKKKLPKLVWLLSFLSTLIICVFMINSKNDFHFCFIDEDKKEPVTIPLNLKILKKNESPLYFKTDKKGCFNYTTRDNSIRIVVTSPYYKTDSITRHKNYNDNYINLKTDDYALMLDYYTNSKVRNWNERKRELKQLFHKDAIIYQLYSKNIGVEIYKKAEFINFLTIPTNSLKKIKILSKKFKNEKIIKLKFIVK